MLAENDSPNRVVVTGYGIHAPVEQLDDILVPQRQIDQRVTWQVLSDDEGGLRCIGAACSNEPPLAYLTQRKWLKYMSLSTQFSVWAAGNALKHSGLLGEERERQLVRESMALMLATGPIAFELTDVLPGVLASRGSNFELDFTALGIEGLRNSSPMMPFHTLRNMPIGLISMIFGMKGHNAIFYPDAEQSLFAFSAAVRGLRSGRMTSVLVGGTAQLLSLMPIVSYDRRGYLAKTLEAATPFSPAHSGWALGNAAAMVVLETEKHARARGARLYGALEVDPTSLNTSELSEHLMEKKANLTLITGTQNHEQDNDAIRLSGGNPCYSLDGVTGYTGAASIALNVAAACQIFENQTAHRSRYNGHLGAIHVLAAVAAGKSSQWGSLRLETIS